MKRYFPINNAYLLSIMLLCSTAIYAHDTMDENECPIVMPDFDDMVLLTREERIQLMDQALKDALSQVQDCRQQLTNRQSQNSGGDGNAGGSDNSNGTNENQNGENASNSETQNQQTEAPSDNETQNQQTATPSSELSGTETSQQTDTQPAQTPTPSSELSGTEPVKSEPKDAIGTLPADQQPTDQTGTQPDQQTIARDNEKVLENGKLPEDIPPADNDDIIAKQIREAALSESDPEKQARLWNEYRRYKGISEK